MTIFRIEKNKSYTIMSNLHLRSTSLSLKAKGLLSQMLSLPDDWDYTLCGLAKINREGIDSIRTAIRELEKEGYITRSRVRNEKGQLGGTEYVIHEVPASDKPTLENPTLGSPAQGNPTQTNKDIPNTEITKNGSDPIIGSPDDEAYSAYTAVVRSNIDYSALVHDFPERKDMIDEIVSLVVEVLCSRKDAVRISGENFPANLVKSQFLKLNMGHIRYVFECLQRNKTDVRNIKQYLLTVLFNAPNTMSHYYAARVNHDFA